MILIAKFIKIKSFSYRDRDNQCEDSFNIIQTTLVGEIYVLHACIFHIRQNFSFLSFFYCIFHIIWMTLRTNANLLFFILLYLQHQKSYWLDYSLSWLLRTIYMRLFHYSTYNFRAFRVLCAHRLIVKPVWIDHNIFSKIRTSVLDRLLSQDLHIYLSNTYKFFRFFLIFLEIGDELCKKGYFIALEIELIFLITRYRNLFFFFNSAT